MFRLTLMLGVLLTFVAASHITTQAQLSISGKVTEPPAVTGVGIEGVTVLLTLNSSTQRMSQTDITGNFSFANVPVGSNYSVAPSKPGFVFNPQSQSGQNLQSNRTLYFTGGPSPNGTIQFESSSVSASESASSISINITRSGVISTQATVDYTTGDNAGASACSAIAGAASSRCDYLTSLGTLTFAPGETTKTISVPLVNDVYVEGNETFTLTLTSAIGATLSTPLTATLTITDNDSAAGSPNPIDDGSFFVRQHYLDFLNREPDSGGLAFWTDQITSCGSDTQCREIRRINVSAAFFLSIEFQETGFLVYRMYKAAFGNPAGKPVPVRFIDFLRDTQQIGKGVQVGVGNWTAQLEANKQAYALQMVQRGDFFAAYSGSMTAEQIVTKMNTNAGGVLSTSEENDLVAMLSANPSDVTKRASVLRSIAEDNDLRSAEFNKAFVLMQYFGYMRRNPDDAPDTDFAGFDFWLEKLNSFNGNFIDAEMVKAFIQSIEYRVRFAP